MSQPAGPAGQAGEQADDAPPLGAVPGDGVPTNGTSDSSVTGGGGLLGLFAGPLIAVASVTAVIAALLFFGHSPASSNTVALHGPGFVAHTGHRSLGRRPGAASRSEPSPAAITSQRHGGGARGTATASASPSTRSGHSHARTSSATAAPHGRGSAKSAHPAVADVTVLNNSRIQGLAASAASELRDRGWSVSAVGNFTGLLPRTTLFYLPGQHRAAEHLASEFSAISQLRLRPGGLPGAGMTLVLTRYWVS